MVVYELFIFYAMQCQFRTVHTAVADPGFPVGGDVESRGGYVSKILYVKTKESGPLGGRGPGTPPPRSANAQYN